MNRRALVAAAGAAILGTGIALVAIFYPRADVRLIDLQQTSTAYLARHAQPDLTFPAGTTVGLHCPMTALSGNLQCKDYAGSYVEMAKNGAPVYQIHTPIPVNGQGRKGWLVSNTNTAAAPNTSVLNIGATTTWTMSLLIQIDDAAAVQRVGTASAAVGAGYGFVQSAGTGYCSIVSGGNQRYQATAAATFASGKLYQVDCWWIRTAGTWESYIAVNGVASGVAQAGTAPNVDITNNQPFTVGKDGNSPSTGTYHLYELQVGNGTGSGAGALARYRQAVGAGTYWADDGSTLAHFKFQETSTGAGLRDGYGTNHLTTVGGTPTAQYGNPPYPMGTATAKRGIWFNGTDAYFSASSSTVLDWTTNDFSVSFWYRSTNTPNTRVLSKRDGGNVGWEVYTDPGANGWLGIFIGDAVGYTSVNNITPILTLGGWHFITINFDRDGNAYAYVNGAAGGVPTSIATRSGSISNAANFTIGAFSGGATAWLKGGVAGVIVANRLTSLAEHQVYRAFKVPSVVTSYTHTPTRCSPIGSEGGFGERLGCYAEGQWPLAYSSTLVHANKNPLGYGFPHYAATTNVLGYSREIDLWSVAGGATLVANKYEGPDGSFTADEVTHPAPGYVGKGVVGAGGAGVGERWCGSVSVKKISGTCTHIGVSDDSGSTFTCVPFSTTWARVSACQMGSFVAKGMYLQGRTAGCAFGSADCVFAATDAQYEASNVSPPCTTTPGNVSQTCNAPLIAVDISSKSALMPQSLYRGEMVVHAAVEPWVHLAGYKRVLGQTASGRVLLTEGQVPSLIIKGQGGSVEGIARGKPIQHTTVARTYTASWSQDTNEGLANTSPRRYAALSIDGKMQKTVMEPRVRTTVDVPTQKDLNSSLWYLGGDGNANSLNGVIETWELYGRPAQVVRTTQPDHVVTVDTTEPAYIANAAIPNLCDYTFGVPQATRWCFPETEYSGPLYDVWNGLALPTVGSPLYQLPSGLMVKGQGRRGVYFGGAPYIQTVSTSVNNLGTSATAMTMEVLYMPLDLTANTVVMASRIGGSGYQMYSSNTAGVVCDLVDNAAGVVTLSKTAVLSPKVMAHVACSFLYSGGAWSGVMTVNGINVGASLAGAATQNIANSTGFTIGAVPNGTLPLKGILHELTVSNTNRSAADLLARYKQSIQTGKYWTDDANTLAHYKFNEATLTNGVGIRDHTTNGNHLTVVSGAPTPRYHAAPWPLGSGPARPAIGSTSAVRWEVADTTVAPANEQPFSAATWFRVDTTAPAYPHLIGHYPGSATWYLYVDSDWAGAAVFWVHSSVGDCYASRLVDHRDQRWHLVAGKITYAGGVYTPTISVDGAAFGGNVSTCTGTVTPAAGNLTVGYNGQAGHVTNLAGGAVWKNYALTDANVATLYGSRDPTGGLLTYARTSTSSKGICYDIGKDPVDGMQVRCFRDGEVPYVWRSESTNAVGNEYGGLGLPRDEAVTNYAYYSERLDTNGGLIGASITADAAVAPDGTKTADALVEDASNGEHAVLSQSGTTAAAAASLCMYHKAGTRAWGFLRASSATLANTWSYFNNSTCTIGTPTGCTATSQGTGNGWCKNCIYFTAKNEVTTARTECASGDGGASYQGIAGNTCMHAWGWALNQAALPHVYCPTPSNATTTCNAPTSMYVAAANIAGWTRAEGVLANINYSMANAWGVYISNAINSNGQVLSNVYIPTWYIFNNVGVIQQQLTAGAIVSGFNGMNLVFDSGEAFYGTRRSYGFTFSGAYAGPFPTYTTDTGANWTPVAGTDLHLGGAAGGTGTIDGAHLLTSIHSTR